MTKQTKRHAPSEDSDGSDGFCFSQTRDNARMIGLFNCQIVKNSPYKILPFPQFPFNLKINPERMSINMNEVFIQYALISSGDLVPL